MNKKDLTIVILLALLIPVIMVVDRKTQAKRIAEYEASHPAQPTPAATTNAAPAELTAAADAAEKKEETVAAAQIELPAEEIIEVLENDKLKLELTSTGGGVKSATLTAYPEFNEKDSAPVVLSFSNSTALAYSGLSGIAAYETLNITKADDGKSVTFNKAWNSGVQFQRVVTLGDDYLLTVNDRFINNSEDPWTLPNVRLVSGTMENPADTKAMKGISLLGVDSYTQSDGVFYWGRKLNRLFKNAGKAASIDSVPEGMQVQPVEWVSVKNKFFTQVIRPRDAAATLSILSHRDMNAKGILPTDIAATLDFQSTIVNSGDALEINYDVFIGPKQYTILKAAGNDMEKVMEFETIGLFSFMNWMMEPVRIFLLWTLNLFYKFIPNYGVAIILLTILMRMLFWPLTHKSTQKMRENSEKMQVVQPKIKEIQAKYKGQAQRIQQETMKVYQEHGFNPMAMMGGCLPLFLQMPIFIALFTVLRNAIELRYSGFLWVSDLSHPENLFAGSIPVVGALNILPLLMSVSMIFQQKLSAANTMAATPEQQQQQKMMMFMMPIMMLFFFYSMPSGLVLYWTTSNLLMIIQTAVYNFRKKRKEA